MKTNRRGFFGTLAGLAGGVYAAVSANAKRDYFSQPIDAGEIKCVEGTIKETVGDVSLVTFTFYVDGQKRDGPDIDWIGWNYEDGVWIRSEDTKVEA